MPIDIAKQIECLLPSLFQQDRTLEIVETAKEAAFRLLDLLDMLAEQEADAGC